MALEPFLAWNDLLLGSSEYGEVASDYFMNRFGLQKHSWLKDVQTVCGSVADNYYMFATVRDPVARICSLYNFIARLVHDLEKALGLGRHELRRRYEELRPQNWLLEWAATKALVFSADFSGFLRDQRLEQDPGFQSQALRLKKADGSMPVECFRLEDQLGDMLNMLAQKFQMQPSIPHENKSAFNVVRAEDLPRADLDHLRWRFREDFELFGY